VNLKQDKRLKRVMLYIFLIIYSTIILYPILWCASNSLKTNREIFASPWNLPTQPQWQNYTEAWSDGRISICFKNSIIVTFLSVAIIAIIAPMAAYSLARLEFKGKKLIFYLFLGGMFIAPISALVPLLILLKNLHLVNTYFGLVFPYVAYGLPLSIFILRSFFVTMPYSLEDAARVDGLSPFKIYWKIMLPLASPALYTAIILQTIFIWNEFLFALVFLRSPDMFTLPRGLMIFRGTYVTMYGPLNAGIIITAVLPIVIYIIFSDRIRKGMTIGMQKG